MMIMMPEFHASTLSKKLQDAVTAIDSPMLLAGRLNEIRNNLCQPMVHTDIVLERRLSILKEINEILSALNHHGAEGEYYQAKLTSLKAQVTNQS